MTTDNLKPRSPDRQGFLGPEAFLIRQARDEDALELIELIGSIFGEYHGCVLDVDGEIPELRAIASFAKQRGGGFWVAEAPSRIGQTKALVGIVGYCPSESGPGIELKKLYVHRHARGTGLGGMLLSMVEAQALAERASFIDLWTDTRFVTAHAFYERRGYIRGPRSRELHDKSHSVEFYYQKVVA